MNRSSRMVVVASALVAAAVFAPPALAEERTCSGAIGEGTLDNVRVPEGAICVLTGTAVKGTVKVERSATLSARDVRVVGNVQAENARDVLVVASTVGGSVQVKQGGGGTVRRSIVTADIQYETNTLPLTAAENRVGGNIQVVGNRGGAAITSNTVDGNLQCKENSPAPTGGGNRVHGSAEDQCKRLAGGAGAPAAIGPGAGGAFTERTRGSAPRPRVGLRRVGRAGRRVLLAGSVVNTTRRRGIVVAIQARRGGSWATLRHARTNSRAGYRTRVRIRRSGRVALRAVVRRQRGVPARLVSPAIGFRVRG